MNQYIIDGPTDASHTFILAHGAGAGMAHPFMSQMAQGIAAKAVTPFLLQRIFELTHGASLEANIALVLNNARLGAKIASEMAKA